MLNGDLLCVYTHFHLYCVWNIAVINVAIPDRCVDPRALTPLICQGDQGSVSSYAATHHAGHYALTLLSLSSLAAAVSVIHLLYKWEVTPQSAERTVTSSMHNHLFFLFIFSSFFCSSLGLVK